MEPGFNEAATGEVLSTITIDYWTYYKMWRFFDTLRIYTSISAEHPVDNILICLALIMNKVLEDSEDCYIICNAEMYRDWSFYLCTRQFNLLTNIAKRQEPRMC